ncbi:chromosome-associated kinesin KIF4-like [Centruroides sculpturatus]|uniref:chromosome-associated kinesin KIF4-like n=1 Tax=Centruroides sculpturatus TaxID=218467 RepID=UPI000C6E0EB0|nr:chromosome-associated kinesin KIF4-like [Centruroides sculpturatus]
MEESNPVKVAVQVQPLLPEEIIDGATSGINVLFEKSQILVPSGKKFSFDYVFDERGTQEQLYRISVQPLLEKVRKGCNGTILTYGQTNTGESYTMGIDSAIQNKGIILHVLNDLFGFAKEMSNVQISIDVSFIEIHNKEIYDLLSERKKKIQIQEFSNKTKLLDVSIINVSSTDDALRWLEKGATIRNTVSTTTYLHSNISHVIFIVYIHHNQSTSKLCFVDLASSEITQSKIPNISREGIQVNLGLLTLVHVMNSLNNKHQKTHKPYRNSLLTRVLKDCLNEETVTLLIAYISSADTCMKETMNTLRYALRARCVKDTIIPKKSNFTILESSSATENYPLTELENINSSHMLASISQPCSPKLESEQISVLNKTLEDISNTTKWNNSENVSRRKSQRLWEKKTIVKNPDDSAIFIFENSFLSCKMPTKNNFKKVQRKQNKAILKFLNKGTKTDLQTLPFIGEKRALAIETHRNTHGPFKSLKELREVEGFSEIFLNRFLKMNAITLD